MPTAQWIKKLSGHAGELFVCAELSKRAIPNALLPENFSDDDILLGDKAATRIGFIQVKACHPERGSSFRLSEKHEEWCSVGPDQFCVFVWLGTTDPICAPRYWIALKSQVGKACKEHSKHGPLNKERRFHVPPAPQEPKHAYLDERWENRWDLFDKYKPPLRD